MRLGGPQWKYNERHEQRVEEEWNCLAHIAFFLFFNLPQCSICKADSPCTQRRPTAPDTSLSN